MPSDPAAVDIMVVDVKAAARGYSVNALIGSDVLHEGRRRRDHGRPDPHP